MEVACLTDLWGLAPLPADCWRQIFGNDRPVAVEIGPGRGEFLLASARETPARNFYAIERSAARARTITEKLARSRVENARVISGDAVRVIGLLPASCVAAFHIQFPDPWWKRRHHKRRLWTPHFVAALRRVLVLDGTVELITDVGDSFALAQSCLSADPGLEVVTMGHPTELHTSFARKAAARGATIYRSVHRRCA
jgi:tRNA (guanine-N7-)-methyltransferase